MNLLYAGRNGRGVINKGSHIPMITMRPSSRHGATPQAVNELRLPY
jgi:hypothetical protein